MSQVTKELGYSISFVVLPSFGEHALIFTKNAVAAMMLREYFFIIEVNVRNSM